MRLLAMLAAAFVIIVGGTALFAPDVLVNTLRSSITPVGVYVFAAIRIAIGAVLLLAARASRAPNGLRLLGLFAIVAGVLTPFRGAEFSRVVLDWEAAQPGLIRAAGVVALTLGSFIAWAVSGRMRATA